MKERERGALLCAKQKVREMGQPPGKKGRQSDLGPFWPSLLIRGLPWPGPWLVSSPERGPGRAASGTAQELVIWHHS